MSLDTTQLKIIHEQSGNIDTGIVEKVLFWLHEKNYWLENFLIDSGFVPKSIAVDTVEGRAFRNGVCIETTITFHVGQKIRHTVTGHGEGGYESLEEVEKAIVLPD